MFDKRNRWMINVIMAIATVAFAGILVFPFIAAFQNGSQTATTATPTASVASRQSDLEAQARGYELVLQREPDNQTALKGLLDIRIQQKDVKGAIAPLEKLAQLNPDQPDYTVLLGQVKQEGGDREGAAKAYRSVLSSRPGDLNALQGLVSLMLQEKRPQAAIGLLQDTLQGADEANQATPGSIDVISVQLLLGRVYAEGGRYDEALAVYDQSIKSDRQDFRPVLGKAIVLQKQGKNEAAQPLFTSAATLAPAQYKDQINQIAAGQTPGATPAPTVSSTPGAATPDASPSP